MNVSQSVFGQGFQLLIVFNLLLSLSLIKDGE